MIVLCANPGCGAVLRAGPTFSPTQTVIRIDAAERYFDCPRCGARSILPSRPEGDERPASIGQPAT